MPITVKEMVINSDFVKKQIKHGYTSAKIIRDKDIVLKHDSYIKRGVQKYQAVINCTIDFKCSVCTIYNALRNIQI